MIAADTNTMIAFIAGDNGKDVEAITDAARNHILYLPPPVLAELTSDPTLPTHIEERLKALPLMEIQPDFWLRTGKTRAILLSKRHKARLADTLIAQCCIDHDAPLITRDSDFQAFKKHCGLKLM